ncbi:MAG: glycosyltransferase [Gammaproteobacteria bacterium]
MKILIKQKILKIILKNLFKIIFLWLYRSNDVLLLQNQDDLASIKDMCKVNDFKFKISIIYGSGINMHKYLKVKPLNIPDFKQDIKIVMLSRLLWTKGVYEFVAAALQIKQDIIKYNLKNNFKINPIFILYGDIDKQNPATINYHDLELWQAEGLIVWRDFCQDVAVAYQDAHIVVLPSYREGLPKSLLEALACAKAIVTTDVPGCREVVKHGINGYLVPKQDSSKLAEVLLSLMQDPELIINMGNAGREIATKEFSNEIILPKILDLYK